MRRLLKTSIVVLTYGLTLSVFSQNRSVISNVRPVEDPVNHYKSLQLLNSSPRSEVSWMDTITFPATMYVDNSILFAMMKPAYLTEGQVGFLVNSVSYPANSSEQTRSELDFLLKLQKERTETQTRRVLQLGTVGYWPFSNYLPSHPSYEENLKQLFFECKEVLGESCSPSAYPNTTKLLQGIMNDMRLMEFKVKYHLLRARPYQLEPRLQPLKKIQSPSFASGHTLWAYIQAYTWGELIPEKRAEFILLAYEIGLSREIMGVHYPSDEEAARQLAHRMLTLMWHDAEFQEDFANAKSEWK